MSDSSAFHIISKIRRNNPYRTSNVTDLREAVFQRAIVMLDLIGCLGTDLEMMISVFFY